MERKLNCQNCGAEFMARDKKTKFCSNKCCQKFRYRTIGRVRPSRKKEDIPPPYMVKIEITKRIDSIFESVRPVYKKQYDALRFWTEGYSNRCYIVEIGGKKIIVRAGECKEV